MPIPIEETICRKVGKEPGKKALFILGVSESRTRGGSRTAALSKMERFMIIVNGFQTLTIITKRSILDVAAVLDPPLMMTSKYFHSHVSSDVRTIIYSRRLYFPFLPGLKLSGDKLSVENHILYYI